MAKLNVKEYGMTLHMNMADGHRYVYSGYIDVPGHPMDGKQIAKKNVVIKKGSARSRIYDCRWNAGATCF